MRTLRDHAEQRAETDWVLSGHAVISLTVEGDQKDKGGRPPSPEYAPSMFEGFGSPFAGLFSSLESEARRARASVGGEVMEEGELGADEEGDSAGEEAELEESDLPEMPSWEEVSSAGERELDENGTPASSGSGSQNRGGGGGLGRTASVWRVNDPKEMAKGKCVGVAQFNTGAVMLAPQMSAVAGLVERCLWSVAVGGDGSVYVGAWADGRLRRMAPDGTVTTVLETPDAVVQAVVVGGDGAVYAATGPSGTIYRIPPERGPAAGRTHGTVLCRLDAQNVWALALDQSDNLWAATGPKGKLYRISITEAGVGTPALQFTAPDRHLTALALAGDGTVYCGTSPLGKVYAVAPDGAVRSVFEVAKATVQSLAVGPDGSVYVGTSPDGRVLKIGPEGAAREVLKTKGRHVLALRAAAGGSVYAVSGPEARIYVVQDDTTWCELPRVESDYVVGMAPGSDGSWYLTAPDTGRLIRLDMSTEGKGSYTSAVRDAGAMARWGAVRRRGESPAESRMSIWTRTGMTAYPDGTWSEWQEVEEGVTSPPGRYLQARVDLSGGTRTPPRMDNLEISYLPANRAPEVSVTAPGPNAMWSGKQTIRWSGKDPDGDKLAYEVSYSVDDGATWTKIEAPAKPKEKEQPKATEGGAQGADKPTEAKPAGSASPRPEPGDQRGEAAPAQGARWPGAQPTAVKPPLGRTTPGDAEPEAGEPEESEEPGEGEEARTEAEPPRPASANRATTLSWDTATAPDGLHRIKVVASDKEADPLNPRTGEAISQSFTVDNTPPGFTLDPTRREDGPPPESVLVWDKTTYVTNVEIRVDQGEWSPVAARDGILDSASETVAIAVEQLPGGAHQLEMRARDAAGNVGTVTLRYKR
jgi:sugar lactone lactonase YvrE